MTRQEAFDLAWSGLAAQGWRRSIEKEPDGYIETRYLCGDGRRCGYGHILGDRYDPEFEGFTMEKLLKLSIVADLGLPLTDDMAFAIDLQKAHDIHGGGAAMEAAFRQLAADYSLTVPE